MMIAPAARLTHTSTRGVMRARSSDTAPLRIAHQPTDPANTPSTSSAAPLDVAIWSVSPAPAKIAVKSRIVCGLLSVKNRPVA